MSDLSIYELSDRAASVTCDKTITLICKNVKEDDIKIRFYEEKYGECIWEEYGCITEFKYVHKCKIVDIVVIFFKIPKYKTIEIYNPVNVWIELKRPSDNICGVRHRFTFTPDYSDKYLLDIAVERIENQIELTKICISQSDSTDQPTNLPTYMSYYMTPIITFPKVLECFEARQLLLDTYEKLLSNGTNKELLIEHPAAKIFSFASEMCGSDFVIIFAGALLEQAGYLLKTGLKTDEVCESFTNVLLKTLKILKTLATYESTNRPKHFVKDLVLNVCTLPKKTSFNVDKVCKILGSNIYNYTIIKGIVNNKRQNKKQQDVIAVYSSININTTETKGRVLIESAEELENFSRGEEIMIKEQIKAIADAGVTVIVTNCTFGINTLHYLNENKIMGIQITSLLELSRFCKFVLATALTRLTLPNKKELGHANCIYADELEDTPLVVFHLDGTDSPMSTFVVCSATDNYMDDIERAIDDGDGNLLPDARDVELANKVDFYVNTLTGLERYAAEKFAVVLKKFVKIGVESYETQDDTKVGIVDSYLQYATQAACTILKVDEIIMAKQAGGPKAPGGRAPDNDDDA